MLFILEIIENAKTTNLRKTSDVQRIRRQIYFLFYEISDKIDNLKYF